MVRVVYNFAVLDRGAGDGADVASFDGVDDGVAGVSASGEFAGDSKFAQLGIDIQGNAGADGDGVFADAVALFCAFHRSKVAKFKFVCKFFLQFS